MRRRDLFRFIGGAALTSPIAADAQPAKRRLVATLSVGAQASVGAFFEIFHQALGALVYGDDRISIESRWADGHAERLPGQAAQLVRLSPDVIVAGNGVVATALRRVTTTIPIVTVVFDDPVGRGLVVSLARPGGNVTGMSFAQEDTVGRELQLLKTMVPRARRVAVLANPTARTSGPIVTLVKEEAGAVQAEVIEVDAANPEMIEPAFVRMKNESADATLVLGDGMFTAERKRIVGLAATYRLPAIYHDHIFVEDGGLMSYGADLGDNYQRAAVFVDKILKGTNPAEIPVEQPTKFYLYINRTTASALGLAVPQSLLAEADQVIE